MRQPSQTMMVLVAVYCTELSSTKCPHVLTRKHRSIVALGSLQAPKNFITGFSLWHLLMAWTYCATVIHNLQILVAVESKSNTGAQ